MSAFVSLFYNIFQVFFSVAFVKEIFMIVLVGLAFVAIIFNLFSRRESIF